MRPCRGLIYLVLCECQRGGLRVVSRPPEHVGASALTACAPASAQRPHAKAPTGAPKNSRWALARTRQAPGARTPRTSRCVHHGNAMERDGVNPQENRRAAPLSSRPTLPQRRRVWNTPTRHPTIAPERPAMPRRPTPADASSPLPSLDDVRTPSPDAAAHTASPARRAVSVGLAAGVAAVAGGGLYAADAPVCGSTRAEELAAHSTVAGQSLRRADLAQTLREMGLALGWVHHTSTAVSPEGPEVLSPGEAPMVTPQPPDAHSLGGPMQVDPTPPPGVDGGIRAVQPTPPGTTPPSARDPAHHAAPTCPRRYRSYRAGAPRSAPGRHLPGEPRAPRQHPSGVGAPVKTSRPRRGARPPRSPARCAGPSTCSAPRRP